ncbi:MAG: DUF6057 family protein [Planctomycetota bacterium]
MSNRHLVSFLRSFICFALFYLYLWLVVDLRLIYGGCEVITNFPAFFKGWMFLRNFLSHPGGPIEYIGAFLSQLFYIGWAGALVVTMQAWLMSACTSHIFKAINLSGLHWLRFVPPILLLITYTQYTYHFVTTMAFLTALLFACLYLRATLSLASNHCRLAVLLVLSIVLYCIAGGAYLLFAVLCAIYELLFKGRCWLGLLYLLSAAAIPYVEGVLVFGSNISDAFSHLLPFSRNILSFEDRRKLIIAVYILYLFLPSTILVSGLWQKTQSSKVQISLHPWLKKLKFNTGSPILRLVIESFALLAIAFAAVFFSYDSEKKALFATHYYACHRMWPQVLRAARRNPRNIFVVNAVNRALYYTGRLGYDMFSWPQHADALLMTGGDRVLECWHKFDTQIDLGLINMAEKKLTECMEVFGEHPMILKRLALINMVKANYGPARTYLGALSKTLFHSDWANDYLARLQSDPNLSADDRIQHLRSVCVEKDYPAIFFPKEKMLCDLLEKNSKNRMAFEYLMAWYMLTRQLDNSVRTIERLSDFDYPELPRLYEEAALVHVYDTKEPIHLAGYQATPEARQRIEHFTQIFNKHKRNTRAAFDELAKDYSDSYFFYHIYGISGVSR